MPDHEVNFIEVTYSDGTIARWRIPDSDVRAELLDKLEDLFGSPDTIIA